MRNPQANDSGEIGWAQLSWMGAAYLSGQRYMVNGTHWARRTLIRRTHKGFCWDIDHTKPFEYMAERGPFSAPSVWTRGMTNCATWWMSLE